MARFLFFCFYRGMISNANLNFINKQKPTAKTDVSSINNSRTRVGIVSAPYLSNTPIQDAIFLHEKNIKPLPTQPTKETKETKDFKKNNLLTLIMLSLGAVVFLMRKKR